MQGINKMLPPVPTQWGTPLTGAQMQRLQDAGLRACGFKMTGESQVDDKGVVTKTYDKYHLPADHIAYTLLEAGWLDGRNVALSFGGYKAPDDWDGKHVLLRKGLETWGADDSSWVCVGDETDIIAYIRKADACAGGFDAQPEYPPANEKLKEAVRLSREMTAQPETVTIAKMTETEARKRFAAMAAERVVSELGLIRELTRLERFWRSKCREGELWEDIIKEALDFERD